VQNFKHFDIWLPVLLGQFQHWVYWNTVANYGKLRIVAFWTDREYMIIYRAVIKAVVSWSGWVVWWNDAVQERSAAEAEEKSRLMSQVDELRTTVDQLTADIEARRVEADSLTEQLQQAKLNLDVSAQQYSLSVTF